jgi:hypothetical protein
MFGGIFSTFARVAVALYLWSQVAQLVAKKNDLLTVVIVKDVVASPTETIISHDDFEVSAYLYTTYAHLPKPYTPEWRAYFRVMYLYESAYWEGGLYKQDIHTYEGVACGLDKFKLTEPEQEIYAL